MARMRRQEPALAGRFLERLVKRGRIKQRNPPDAKHGVVRDCAVARDDIERRRGQPPPRPGNLAVRHKALMQYITVFFTFCPFPLEIKGVIGCKQAWSCDNFGW